MPHPGRNTGGNGRLPGNLFHSFCASNGPLSLQQQHSKNNTSACHASSVIYPPTPPPKKKQSKPVVQHDWLAETSFQNRYAQSLQPDTRLSVTWFPIVSFSQPALQDCSPVQMAAPTLQLGMLAKPWRFFLITTSYDIKPLLYAFFPSFFIM